MVNKNIKFKDLRKYISVIDKISICDKESLKYENFLRIEKVPDKYDDFYVYGIGLIESEFPENLDGSGQIVLSKCIEIMITNKPKFKE